MPGKRRLATPGRRRLATSVALAALLAAWAGCGHDGGPGRRPISGEVTLDGRPLAEGRILLEPAPGEAAGTVVGGRIRRGLFAIPRREGPAPGSYLVRIYANSREQAAPLPGQSALAPRPMIDPIPARYNRSTTLGLVVAPSGANECRFDLRSGPDPANP